MKNIITYKEYSGIVEFEDKKRELCAKVIGTKVSLICSGSSVDELIAAFQQTIDAYLDECHAKKIEPEHPFKGSFNVRVSPCIHKQASEYALSHNLSLNTLVNQALRFFLQEKKKEENQDCSSFLHIRQ